MFSAALWDRHESISENFLVHAAHRYHGIGTCAHRLASVASSSLKTTYCFTLCFGFAVLGGRVPGEYIPTAEHTREGLSGVLRQNAAMATLPLRVKTTRCTCADSVGCYHPCCVHQLQSRVQLARLQVHRHGHERCMRYRHPENQQYLRHRRTCHDR